MAGPGVEGGRPLPREHTGVHLGKTRVKPRYPLDAWEKPDNRVKWYTAERAVHARQRPKRAADLVFVGADDEIRTRDPHLGKVMLYH